MNFSFYIAKRYLLAKKSRNAINVISGVSVAGVTVGTMALIIVLSVFNGLEDMVKHIFNTFDPDLKVTAVTGKVFTPDPEKLLRLSGLPGIEAFSLTIEENSLLKYGERQYIAVIKGIDSSYLRVTSADSTITEGEFRVLSPGGRPEAVVGAGVANYLGVNINFVTTPLHVYVPRRTASITPDPENAFIDRYLFPSGLFRIEHEFDSKYIFVPLAFARDLLEYDDEAGAIEIRIRNNATPGEIQNSVKQIMGPGFEVKNRFEQKEIFYRVMRSERLAIFIILTLILIIASFNITGSLTMLIIEKERDITILKSLGADNNLIRKIFLLEGWLISIAGAAAGIVTGFIICLIQQKYGIIRLNADTLMLTAYPVVLKLKDFIIVPATVLLIGFLAAWYPVRYLTKKYLVEKTGEPRRPGKAGTVTVVMLAFLTLFSSCSDKEERIRKSRTIPPKEFVTLLTDLYIADGLLAYPPVKNAFRSKDSTLNYIDIIHAHGFTKEQVDLTIEHYYEKNPGKLEKIYDEVISRLSEIQSRLEAEPENDSIENLWNMRTSFSIPADGKYNKIWFSIPVKDTGNYFISFKALVFPDDQSMGLSTNVFFWRADSTKEGLRDYWEPQYYITDGTNHQYTFSKRLTDTAFTHIKGWLLEHEQQERRWVMHVKITGIKLYKGDIIAVE